MIFTIGAVLFIVALMCDVSCRPVPMPFPMVVVGLAGIGMMLLSIGLITWRTLP